MAKRHPGLSERHRKIMEFLSEVPGCQRLFPFHPSNWRQHQRKIHLSGGLLLKSTAGNGLYRTRKPHFTQHPRDKIRFTPG